MKFPTLVIAAAIGAMSASGAVYAAKGGDDIIDDDLTRRPAGSTSGSGDTVVGNCGDNGNAWQDATGTITVAGNGAGSEVQVEIEGAIPYTVFTVWQRVQGGTGWNRDVNDNKGSPLTGGGATPMCSGTELDDLNAISPWVDEAGASSSCNSFTTDAAGDGTLKVDLNYNMVGGAYPFYQTATSRPGWENVPNVGYAIPSPSISPGTPFLLRVISHCTDNASHGLSPATREAWFQYP
jgi:hypothetical protein